MLDLDALLAPIPGPSPCGEDMLFSTQFDAIQRARQHDDPSLEQGDWVIDLKEANWPFVVSESSKLLRESTKDLRLAVWLTDATASSHGFAGLADGYRLLTQLCERFWDGLFPLPEDGDMDVRVGNITWLVARTTELLQRTPIVGNGTTRYNFLTWETAVSLDHNIKRDASQADELRRGKVTLEQFDQVRRATPAKFLVTVHTELRDCEEAILQFEQVFDEKTAATGPSFGKVKEMLANIRHATERFAKDAGVALGPVLASPPSPVAATSERVEPTLHEILPVTATPTAPGGAMRQAGVHSRAQAIAQLKEVAAYFERTEPSSPAAYMANKAARWADMSLHAWLRNVIKNEQELAQLEELLDVLERAKTDGDAAS